MSDVITLQEKKITELEKRVHKLETLLTDVLQGERKVIIERLAQVENGLELPRSIMPSKQRRALRGI